MAATSWTRTIRAPWAMAQVAVANDPGSRSPTGTDEPPDDANEARKLLRLVPTMTG